ncbi:TolC family protein [bacterium]|nr:TolC family protein [candidate division CSSED10-310 bacterium]
MKIAIIDDDTALLRSLNILLSQKGFEVYTYSTGEKALDEVVTIEPDYLFVDCILPGLSGEALLSSMHTQLPSNSKIVMMSGHSDRLDAAAAADFPIHAYLLKPLDLVKVIEIIQDSNNSKRITDQNSDRKSLSNLFRIILLWVVTLMEAGCLLRTVQYPADMKTFILEQTERNPEELEQTAAPINFDTPVLHDYLETALLNNHALKSDLNYWRSVQQKRGYAGGYPDPKITIGYFLQEIETRVGPQKYKIGVSQTIPLNRKLNYKTELAQIESEIARLEFERNALSLIEGVKQLYWELAYLGKRIEITKETLFWLDIIEKLINSRFIAGLTGQDDLLKTQIEMDLLKNTLVSLEEQKKPLKAELNGVLGIPVDHDFPLPEIPEDIETTFTIDEVKKQLLLNNKDLLILDLKAEKATKKVDLVKSSRIPDVTVGLDYIVTGPATMPDTRDSGKDPIMAAISFTLPIWRQQYQSEEHEARYIVEVSNENRKQLKQKLDSNLLRLWFEINDAERQLKLYRSVILPRARQSRELSLKSYSTGLTNISDLIDSNRTLLQLQIDYYVQLKNKLIAIASLERMTSQGIYRSESEHLNNETNLSEPISSDPRFVSLKYIRQSEGE